MSAIKYRKRISRTLRGNIAKMLYAVSNRGAIFSAAYCISIISFIGITLDKSNQITKISVTTLESASNGFFCFFFASLLSAFSQNDPMYISGLADKEKLLNRLFPYSAWAELSFYINSFGALLFFSSGAYLLIVSFDSFLSGLREFVDALDE